ncbi:unnamed protein product [Fructobacillus tropaeoli]|nr:unnamed protein product [Fructobacillus tropaeoli]
MAMAAQVLMVLVNFQKLPTLETNWPYIPDRFHQANPP